MQVMDLMYVKDGKRCHRRKEIVCGLSEEFVERVGEQRSMKSRYRVGADYEMWLNTEEKECMERMRRGPFVVNVVGIEVRPSEQVRDEERFGREGPLCLVVKVKPVSEVVDGGLDTLVRVYWLDRSKQSRRSAGAPKKHSDEWKNAWLARNLKAEGGYEK